MGRFASNRQIKGQSYSIQLPQATTAFNYGNPAVIGSIRFVTDTNVVQYYDATNSIWQTFAKVGNATIKKDSSLTPLGGGATLSTPNSVLTTFTMSTSYASGSEAQVLVFLGGVYQNPGVAYTFSGTASTTVTFTSAPPTGQVLVILHNFASTTTP